jgi:NAD+ diphosphatase
MENKVKDWVHCPRCASDLAPGPDPSNLSVHCNTCGFAKWDNPLPSTIAVIREGDRVLLTRRSQAPRIGTWDAVGGFLTIAETAEECVRREALEELGVAITINRMLGTFASTYGDTGLRTIGVAFDCSVASRACITLSEENDRFGWFPLDDLPEIAFDDVRQALQAAAK